MRRLQGPAWRRVRPARGIHRLRPPGGADRDADAEHAGQALMDPRRGHDARLLPPDYAMQVARWGGRVRQADRMANEDFRAIDPGGGLSAEFERGHGPGCIPGPQPRWTGSGVRLRHPERSDRPCDAQPAYPAWLLARRKHESERGLQRMLHR